MKKKSKMKIFFNMLLILFFIAMVLLGIYALFLVFYLTDAQDKAYHPIDTQRKYYEKVSNNVNYDALLKITKDDIVIDNKVTLSDVAINKDYVTFLLLGVDSREGEPARSDTIMVGKYIPNNNKILLVSIPRDSYVAVPGHGNTKVNHSYAYGKAPLTIVTLENFLHIKIDKYVAINFQGFRDIINAMGGLNVDVMKDMYYKDSADGTLIDLKRGQQTLNGNQALGYSRFRHDAQGDIGRMQRQQQVIKEISSQLQTTQNIIKLPQYIEIVGKNLTTDFTKDDINSYMYKFMQNRNIDVQFDTLSGNGGIAEDGLYYFKMDQKELDRFSKLFNEFH